MVNLLSMGEEVGVARARDGMCASSKRYPFHRGYFASDNVLVV